MELANFINSIQGKETPDNVFKRMSFLYLSSGLLFLHNPKTEVMSVQTFLTNPFLTPEILMSHNVFSRCYRRLQYLRV